VKDPLNICPLSSSLRLYFVSCCPIRRDRRQKRHALAASGGFLRRKG
jgi:hypothetical protein